jgi:hypothetical protein
MIRRVLAAFFMIKSIIRSLTEGGRFAARKGEEGALL